MSLAALVAAVALTAASQQASTPLQDEAARVGDIEVIGGRSLREAIDDFTDTVVAPPAGRGPARWSDRGKVCVGVVNLKPEIAQALIDRVSQVAIDVGLDVGEPGCRPQIMILATQDGAGLAKAMVDYRQALFRPPYSGASRSRLQLARFQESQAPVRWWHVSMPTIADTGEPAVQLPGEGPPMVPGGSLLRTEIRNELRRAFIIMDVSRVSDVNFRQLSDYVAMAAMAQIDPDADMSSFPTVLNVFADPTSAAGLTDWDINYLKGLYGAELNQRSPQHQAGAIGNIMASGLRQASEQEGE